MAVLGTLAEKIDKNCRYVFEAEPPTPLSSELLAL